MISSSSAGDCSGRSRQSHTISQRAGITLRFSEAEIWVGEMVARSMGSIIVAARGTSSPNRSSAATGSNPSPTTSSRKARSSGPTATGVSSRPSRSRIEPALTSALSAMPGMAAWPLRP